MMRHVAVVALALVLGGCTAGVVRLSPAATKVQVGSSSPGAGYTQVGAISAKNGGGCGLYGSQGSYAGAMNDLRNQAADMGADYVQVISQEGEHMTGMCLDRAYTIDGYAYKKATPSPGSQPNSYYKRVQGIQSRVLSGSLQTIRASVVPAVDSSLQHLSYGEAGVLEAEQTWWFGSDGQFFMYVKNGTSFDISTIKLAFTGGSCENPQPPGKELTVTFASPIPTNGEFVASLPASAIGPIWKSIHCETITNAWAVRPAADS